MNVNRLPAVVLMAGAIVAPASAVARPHKPMTVRYAQLVADVYWTDRGERTACPHPTYRIASDAEMAGYQARDGVTAAMRADVNRCEIISTPLAEAYRRDRDFADVFCADIVHENGHLAGLALSRWDGHQWIDTHPATGVMSSDPAIPWGCTHRRAFLRRIER